MGSFNKANTVNFKVLKLTDTIILINHFTTHVATIKF
jgi:hypothetical protein